jgi:hypothetical protein
VIRAFLHFSRGSGRLKQSHGLNSGKVGLKPPWFCKIN